MASWKRGFLDSMLLTPPGRQTRIKREHYRVINSYLSPGDRIAWHRPWGTIHTAIVLSVDEGNGRICVFERNKSEDGVVVAPNWVKLDEQWGQLYRSDETEDILVWNKLRIMLNKLGEKGYHIFGKNCQHLVDECCGGNNKSFQSDWFAVNLVLQTLKSLGKSATSELTEALFGGAEKIGVVTVIALQVVLFLIEFYVAYHKLQAGDISWKHFADVVILQFSMAVFSCVGSAVGGSLIQFLAARVIVWVVMSLMGALIAQFLLDLIGSDNELVRYLGLLAGGIVGFVCGCFSPGWILEILLASLLGVTGLFFGHGFGYVASWLMCSPGTDSRVIHDLHELKRGDHITTYEWFLHPHCHSIFVEAMPNGTDMKIIRNTYQRGVVEDVVPFKGGQTYRFDYHPTECHEELVVVQNARKQLNEDNYSWFTNNCKTFAEKCKCRAVDETDRPAPRQDVDWDKYFEEMISQPGTTEEKIQDLQMKLQVMMGKVGCLPA